MSLYYETKAYKEDVEAAIEHTVGADRIKGKMILVTGASGLIGAFVTDMLTEAGAEVVAAGRDMDRLNERFPQAVSRHYDLYSEIEFDDRFDYVIHAAGYGHPAAFAEDPVGTLKGTIDGTARLLEYSLTHGVERFLYVSSGEVYGGIDPMDPRGCYPIGKQAAECLCASYTKQYGLDTAVARLCHTFGPGASKNDNRAATEFIRRASAGEDIVLRSRGVQKRSYLYVADSASAILSVLMGGTSGEAYDIASGSCVTAIAELAETVADAFGVKVRHEPASAKESSQQSPIAEQVLDDSKLADLGWMGAYSIPDGVASIYRMVH